MCVCVWRWRDVCGKLNTPLTAQIFVRKLREGYRGLAHISLFLFQFDSINVRFASRNTRCSGFVWVHSHKNWQTSSAVTCLCVFTEYLYVCRWKRFTGGKKWLYALCVCVNMYMCSHGLLVHTVSCVVHHRSQNHNRSDTHCNVFLDISQSANKKHKGTCTVHNGMTGISRTRSQVQDKN